MKVGISLLRVSTTKQDYKYQKDLILKEAKHRDFSIIKSFEEIVSGKVKNRNSLKEMFEFIDSYDSKIDYVITSELSRVGRTREVLEVIDKLDARGICFITIKEGIRTLNDDGTSNATGKLLISILQGINEYELSVTSFRSMSGLDYAVKTKNVAVGSANYGYYIEDKQYHIDEEEANIVKLIFDYYGVKGWGLIKIRNWLNTNNISPKYSDKWEEGTLRQIVSNTIYKGVRKFTRYKNIVEKGKKKKVVDNIIEVDAPELRIIEDSLFSKCQNRQHKNVNFPKITKKFDALLDGHIIKCGVCGRHFIPIFRKNLKYDYYSCYSTKHSKGCGNKNIIMEYVDLNVKEYIVGHHKELLFNNKTSKVKKSLLQDDIALHKEQLSKNQDKLKRLKTSFFDSMLIDESEFKSRLDTLNIESDKINKTISSIQDKLDEYDDIMDVDKIGISFFKNNNMKELLHKIINGIVVDQDRVVVYIKGGITFDFQRPPKRWNIDKYYEGGYD